MLLLGGFNNPELIIYLLSLIAADPENSIRQYIADSMFQTVNSLCGLVAQDDLNGKIEGKNLNIEKEWLKIRSVLKENTQILVILEGIIKYYF